jgi:alpha-tubulin suppressor-like RCC1 family protein
VTRPTATQATACALVDDGVLCWGTNDNGQLDVPTLTSSTTAAYEPGVIATPNGSPIERIVVGNAAFALTADTHAISWGANPPLGRVSSLFPDPYPRAIALETITDLDASLDQTCAIANGAVYCWGAANNSPIDPHPPMERALPRQVPLPEPATQISTAGVVPGAIVTVRACAVGVSGDVWCWGENRYGQAGDGTRTFVLEPTKVPGLPGPTAQVRVTRTATCALSTTGKVSCWGDDLSGQLGNGQLKVPSLTPLEVVLP